MSQPFEVKKGLFGRYAVSYDCPHCGERLKSSLDDAGKTDTCPNCRFQYSVPGAKEAAQVRNDKEAAAQEAAAVAEQKKQLRALEQRKREAELEIRENARRDERLAQEQMRQQTQDASPK